MRRKLTPWLLLLLALVLSVASAVIGIQQAPSSNDTVVFDAVQNTLNAPDFVAVSHTVWYPSSGEYYFPVITKFQAPYTFVQTSHGVSLRPQGYTLSGFDSQFKKHPKGWTKHGAFYERGGTVDGFDTLRVSYEIQRGYLIAALYDLRFFASTDREEVNVSFERIGKWNIPQSVSPVPVE
jgi:hypothetical protein